MKVALIVSLSVLVIFLIIIFPFRARLQLLLNLVDRFSVYSIKILFIKILLGRASLDLNGLNIENAVNKLYSDKNDPSATNKFNLDLVKRVKCSKVNIIMTFGALNPEITAIISGTSLALSGIISSSILNKNPNCKVFVALDPRFNQIDCEIVLQLTIKLSLLQLLLSFIHLKKEMKNV